MSAALLEQVGAALRAFSSITRSYELKLEGDSAQDAGLLLVEAFASDEQLPTSGGTEGHRNSAAQWYIRGKEFGI